MKTIPKHYKLVAETPDHYEIHDARDKKHFKVAKRDLSLAMHAKLSKIQHFDEGGPAQPEDSPTPSPDASPAPTPSSPVVVNVGDTSPSALPAIPNATSVATGQPIDANAPAAPVSTPVAPTPQMPATAPMSVGVPAAIPAKLPPTLEAQARANEALSEAGVRGLQGAQTEQEEANARILRKQEEDRENRMAAFQKTREDMGREIDQLSEEVMNQNIDPSRYWHTNTLPRTISSGIGIILGGIGQGMMGSNTNQALNVVQERIRQDIDAQKADLGKKQSLLSMNMARYRDLPTAYAATEAQMSSMVAGQIQLAAAQSGSLRAKANAEIATAKLRNDLLGTLPNLALQDYRIKELHQLNGTTPPPTAAGQILGPKAPSAQPPAPPTEKQSEMPFWQKALFHPKDLIFSNLTKPNNLDEAREHAVNQEQEPAPDPYRYGMGVNKDKMTALKITGNMTPEQGQKATDEYGNYSKLQNELKWADNVFDSAAKNATLRGRISRGLEVPEGDKGEIGGAIATAANWTKRLIAAGDEEDKNYNAVVDPFIGSISKDVAGRDNPIPVSQLRAVMPEEGDDLKTRVQKRAALHDVLKRSYKFPTLQEHGLVAPNDPLIAISRK